jgi:hypothetical protein
MVFGLCGLAGLEPDALKARLAKLLEDDCYVFAMHLNVRFMFPFILELTIHCGTE